MKRRLMDVLRCPVCGGRLDLHALSENSEAVPLPPPVPAPVCRQYCARHDRAVEPGFAPNCRACYGSDVAEGFLSCSACTLLYPVIAGVPRLVRNAYDEYGEFFYRHREVIGRLGGHEETFRKLGRVDPGVFDRRSNESFSLQWERYQYEDRTWFKDDTDLRRGEFLHSMDLPAERLDGALVLDAGCGNGRLTASVARYGAEMIGMDLSRSVERAFEKRASVAGEHAPYVHFIQGNVLEPPLAPECVDHGHTSGVLHHTPDTRRAFLSFLTLIRPGGHVYVQLYRTREAWVGIPNKLIRAVTSRLPVRMLYRLCYAGVPLHTGLVLVVAKLRGERSPIRGFSRRERAISMFDNYSPRYQFRYRPEEVRRMFEAAGLIEVKDVTFDNEKRHMVAFVGLKPAGRKEIVETPARSSAA
jgi:2-polyprenyl-3-methyl-5-hydroxy-6-metoxy-1,4-benzoquinol methylase